MKEKFLDAYRKWGVYLALLVLGMLIVLAAKWVSVTLTGATARWVTFPLSFLNIGGAVGLIVLGLKQNVSSVWKLPFLLIYYLVIIVVGFLIIF